MNKQQTTFDDFFSECYLKYREYIKNYIAIRICHPHEAEDLAQDVFVRLWEQVSNSNITKVTDNKTIVTSVYFCKNFPFHRDKSNRHTNKKGEVVTFDDSPVLIFAWMKAFIRKDSLFIFL